MNDHSLAPVVLIQQFIQRAVLDQLIDPLDQLYLRNQLLHLLQLEAYPENITDIEVNSLPSLLDSLDALVTYAIEQEIIPNINYAIDQFENQVMDLITPLPSQVNANFWRLYQDSPEQATDYFYQLSQTTNYIKTRQIAKNIHFIADSSYGELEITINLSKPEKDPKQIALEAKTQQVDYPMCALCMENEGYHGRVDYPSRQTHRIVRMQLDEAEFGMQYSPYVYYNEHSIFLSQDHTPMTIDRECFSQLLAIVDQLPHYFVGSNTDLPIVGGSILSHDHYQGGRHTFPLDHAQVDREIELAYHPQVQAEIMHWPMSVIRLTSSNRTKLLDAAEDILLHWRQYSDANVDIQSHTEETRHNTVTPIAHRLANGQGYRLDIVLRNNRTNAEYPDGIFHPHPDVQHIKKENIGLIEVLGLAILPPRLVEETQQIQAFLIDQLPLEAVESIHHDWAQQLKSQLPANATKDQAMALIQQSMGEIFARVLEDAGVFKRTPDGQAAFDRFIQTVNQQTLL